MYDELVNKLIRQKDELLKKFVEGKVPPKPTEADEEEMKKYLLEEEDDTDDDDKEDLPSDDSDAPEEDEAEDDVDETDEVDDRKGRAEGRKYLLGQKADILYYLTVRDDDTIVVTDQEDKVVYDSKDSKIPEIKLAIFDALKEIGIELVSIKVVSEFIGVEEEGEEEESEEEEEEEEGESEDEDEIEEEPEDEEEPSESEEIAKESQNNYDQKNSIVESKYKVLFSDNHTEEVIAPNLGKAIFSALKKHEGIPIGARVIESSEFSKEQLEEMENNDDENEFDSSLVDDDLETDNVDEAKKEKFISKKTGRELSPRVGIRSRGKCIFPAEHPKVLDNKDHFPINDVGQARNALARVNQYKEKPSWYKGNLTQLKKTVCNAVKRAYPSIKVSKRCYEAEEQ